MGDTCYCLSASTGSTVRGLACSTPRRIAPRCKCQRSSSIRSRPTTSCAIASPTKTNSPARFIAPRLNGPAARLKPQQGWLEDRRLYAWRSWPGRLATTSGAAHRPNRPELPEIWTSGLRTAHFRHSGPFWTETRSMRLRSSWRPQESTLRTLHLHPAGGQPSGAIGAFSRIRWITSSVTSRSARPVRVRRSCQYRYSGK